MIFIQYGIQSRVPKDRLLIWNVKDGWGPICRFLNKDIPKQAFPIINKARFITVRSESL